MSENGRIDYVANGETTVFAFPFFIMLTEDLTVVIDDVEQDTGFKITGVLNPNGGSVIFDAPPVSGSNVTLILTPVPKRLVTYQQDGDLNSDTLNKDFDRLYMLALSSLNTSNRSLSLGLSDIDGQGAYRAGGNRIENLGEPQNPNDAVRLIDVKQYTDEASAAAEAANNALDEVIELKKSVEESEKNALDAVNEAIEIIDNWEPEGVVHEKDIGTAAKKDIEFFTGRLANTRIILANENYVPTSEEIETLKVRTVGAGGGAGSAIAPAGSHATTGGGAGGGTAISILKTKDLTFPIPVVIGLGGNAGYDGAKAGTGGTTEFGSYLSATGGEGSNSWQNGTGIVVSTNAMSGGTKGGEGVNGNLLNLKGGAGGYGMSLNQNGAGGLGGSSSVSPEINQKEGGQGTNGELGAGGSGVFSREGVGGWKIGGKGGDGLVVVEEYY